MKNFSKATIILAGAALLFASVTPVRTQAESLEDVFSKEELEILFGAGGRIPQRIGPHRVVMSMEEASQVEGEVPPLIVIIGAATILGGAFAGGSQALVSGGNVARGAAAGAGSGAGSFVGGLFGGAGGAIAGGAIGGTATAAACSACHSTK